MLISCIHGAAVGGARNRLSDYYRKFNVCDVVTSQPEFVTDICEQEVYDI